MLPINISKFEKITIVPDKILHYLPFEVLSNNVNEYIIENYIIKNSISIPLLTFNEENDTNKELTVANNCPIHYNNIPIRKNQI